MVKKITFGIDQADIGGNDNLAIQIANNALPQSVGRVEVLPGKYTF